MFTYTFVSDFIYQLKVVSSMFINHHLPQVLFSSSVSHAAWFISLLVCITFVLRLSDRTSATTKVWQISLALIKIGVIIAILF